MTDVARALGSMILVGFISELSGNEDHLLQVEPVIRVGGLEYVAPSDAWQADDVRLVTDDLKRFVNYLDADSHRELLASQVVWLAGGNFVSDLHGISSLGGNLRVGSWPLFGPGFRWSVGTPTQFAEYSMQLAQQLEKSLYAALFDALEKSHGDATSIMRLYEVLDIPRTLQREVNVGLFYYETRDMRSYDLVRFEAVLEGVVQRPEQFDQEVSNFADDLRKARLSESNEHPAAPPRLASSREFIRWMSALRDHSETWEPHPQGRPLSRETGSFAPSDLVER